MRIWHSFPVIAVPSCLASLTLAFAFSQASAPAQALFPGPLDQWQERPSPAQGHVSLNAITFANGLFVAVGDYGMVLTSSNGVEWTEHNSGGFFPVLLHGIAWGNGGFVTVGGLGNISTSADGATWAPLGRGVGHDLWSVTYGDGFFVAVGADGVIVSSRDGYSWTRRNSATTAYLRGVAYGNGTFVAVGNDRIFQSGCTTVRLSGRMLPNGGGFEVTAEGGLEGFHQLQATTDVANTNWSFITSYSVTYTNAQSVVRLPDPAATNYPGRFYRSP